MLLFDNSILSEILSFMLFRSLSHRFFSALSSIEKKNRTLEEHEIKFPTASRWDCIPHRTEVMQTHETLISNNLINVQSKCNYELLSGVGF